VRRRATPALTAGTPRASGRRIGPGRCTGTARPQRRPSCPAHSVPRRPWKVRRQRAWRSQHPARWEGSRRARQGRRTASAPRARWLNIREGDPMPTSTSHGRPYIEPERHDELSDGVAAAPSGPQKRYGGRFTSGPDGSAAEAGGARRVSSSFVLETKRKSRSSQKQADLGGGAGNRTQVRKSLARASTYVSGTLYRSGSRLPAGSHRS
jgi:hypothetical protein